MSKGKETSSDSPFSNVPVEISVSIGRLRPAISELLQLSPGSIMEVDRSVDDPVELYVGDRLFALGELVESEDATRRGVSVRLISFLEPREGK